MSKSLPNRPFFLQQSERFKKHKIGLLAQDVQKAFPELVKTTNDSDKTLSVNYQGLIPVLINAIKEQQKQIDELKKLIK